MWILKGPKGETFYLLPGKEYIVGRKDGDLVFSDDQSISRKHSIITVQHPSKNWDDPDEPPTVNITEPGSKYGTVINPASDARKIAKNVTQQLCNGDTIQFGLQWNVWRLVHEPLVVVMSALTGAQKKEVRDVVGKLGGHIVSKWELNCTHLTMSSFTMTVKAIIALAHGKAIIVPEFWKKFLSSVQNKEELPKYEEFLPPLAETIINKNEVSFLIKPERRNLFQGKEFLFFTSQQHKEYSCLVTAAGGKASVIDLEEMLKEKMIEPHIIVMQHLSAPSCPVSQTPQSFMEVITYFQDHGKRVIPVSEIGLAILHCSIEKYCNPSFSFASAMLFSNKNNVYDIASQQTLASETQESLTSPRRTLNTVKGKVIIPESGTVSKQPALSRKEIYSEPTLLMDISPTAPQQSSEKVKLEEKSSQKKGGYQKRPRNECDVAEIKEPLKKMPCNRSKRSNQSFETKSDDAEGLFDFVNDNTRNNIEEENMFAFNESLPVEMRDKNGDEEMFSFQNTNKNETLTTSAASCSSGYLIQKNGKKRKLSPIDENEISDKLHKKLALENNSGCSKSELDRNVNESHDEFLDFLSAPKIKKEKSLGYSVDDNTCNSSLVLLKPLITSQSFTSRAGTSETSVGQNTNNFKKFRKSQIPSLYNSSRIIAGRDLVPYAKNTTASVRSFFDDNSDIDDDIDGEKDDWAFQTVSQTKKKGQSRRL